MANLAKIFRLISDGQKWMFERIILENIPFDFRIKNEMIYALVFL
jgi:hypothetical protein